MRIAVDVMGGDHGCGVVIAGVKKALEDNKNISAIFLVGHQDEIHAALPVRGFRDHRVRVVHASEVVEMNDKPASALRKKRDSSIARAAELVSDGKADAMVSLYNAEPDQQIKQSIVDGLYSQRNAKALVDIARAEKDNKLKLRIVERLSNIKSKEASDYLAELLKK